MALAIVATVGSASANSYVTLAAAETALEARLNASLWTAATDDTKNRALVEAQKELQTLPWKGSRTDDTQVLAWPRAYVENIDASDDADIGETGVTEYADTVIPDRVSAAQIELAFQFVKAGTTDLAVPSSREGVKRKRVDVLETEYFENGAPARGIARYPRVYRLIAPLLDASQTGLSVVRA
jgi:hypothetical protein